MNWDDLKYYLAVARARGLSEAARSLGVSPSTVSRRIQELELAIGSELFYRRQDGYVLSEAGLNLLPAAEQAESSLLWLERGAATAHSEAAGVVRIAAPELLGQYLIIPKLVSLLDRYPKIQLEVVTDVRPDNLSKREADIVIRLNRPLQGDYTVQRIGSLKQGLYSSVAYLQGIPLSEREDIANYRLIGWDSKLAYLPLAQLFKQFTNAPQPSIKTGSFNAQLMAVKSGLGIAALPKFTASLFDLNPVFVQQCSLDSTIWLVRQTDSRQLKRVDLVANYIKQIIEESQSILH
ncbi:MAG: LysR family transcriptional regulator [Pseudomonadales bacterium]